jgi:hypothetical protein
MVVDYVRVYAKAAYTMPSAGVVKKTARALRPSGSNLLEHGSFDGPDPRLWQVDGRRRIEEPRVENGELMVRIHEDVREQHLQSIRYAKYLEIKKDATYRLSFRARSSVPCKHVRPAIDRPNANWAKLFLYSSLEMTAEWKEYSMEFTATSSDRDSRLIFYMGLMEGDVGGGNHTIHLDDIRLEEMID